MMQTGQNQKPDIITVFQALVKTDMEHFTVPEDREDRMFADIMNMMQGGAK